MSEKDYSASKIKNIVEMVSLKKTVYVSNFLNPYEQSLWNSKNKNVNFKFWGGYEEAERKVVIAFCSNLKEDSLLNNFNLSVVEASLNDFSSISHRQVLGSLIHNGINREVIGDILITSRKIQIIIKSSILKFLIENPLNVNKNILNFREIGFDQIEKPVVKSLLKTDTVPSLRLDAFLSKVLNISRLKSQTLISQGKVFVDFKPVSKSAYVLTKNEFVTARGFGRIKLNRVIGRSKKNKIVIEYQKL
ncbi:YlmH/Sll1252 family protein [Xylocopilactobacillus apis]|uniref:RNA-binding protein S4 n=1 Tax=Xylocopilactobacillus apis TaxID=2932183 RepID=A0AAU9DDJ3_9LACO|nr:YlmH/Sll1252 family protein [Xylocopilactobacillus apis]BDR56221.1 RNA-binding protein S4 [Xylocopilactobacillus apis]